MADRTFYPSWVYGFARIYLDFQFQANGASNPTLVFSGQSGTQTVFGIGSDVLTSITYAATGVYSVQLSARDHYNKVVYKSADVDDVASDNPGAYATVGNVANEGSGTVGIFFKVRTYTAGGTAVQLAAGHVIYVMCSLRNSAGSNPA